MPGNSPISHPANEKLLRYFGDRHRQYNYPSHDPAKVYGTHPDIVDRLNKVGITTMGACGDIARNIVSCPVAGLHPGEVLDVRPAVLALHEHFTGNKEFSNLPRKYKLSVTACPEQCCQPEIHDSRAEADVLLELAGVDLPDVGEGVTRLDGAGATGGEQAPVGRRRQSWNRNGPKPLSSIRFRNCFGMI